MRLGVLTGGGDCPGLNAVLRGLVRRGVLEFGHEFVGILNGYEGLMEPTLETALRKTYPTQQENMASQDYIEGPKAFAEKRTPNWQNK